MIYVPYPAAYPRFKSQPSHFIRLTTTTILNSKSMDNSEHVSKRMQTRDGPRQGGILNRYDRRTDDRNDERQFGNAGK